MPNTLFLLVISGTDTIKHPGISAAGANHEMLPYTAALDAEFIYHGHTKTLDKLPISPNNIVSPALISKACLNLLGIDKLIIDTGAHIKPQCPYITVREKPSGDISTGQTMTYDEVVELYQTGKNFHETIKNYNHVIIAECIVGGTTTALGLLEALGYKCSRMLSSSFPDGNHSLKEDLVRKGLSQAQITHDPLTAVAAMGDPMQAFTCGLAQSCSENNIQVTLAGGTQMIAIASLIEKLNPQSENLNRINILTTPWVIHDQSAQFIKLQEQCCPNIKALTFNPNLLDTYEDLDSEILKLSNNALSLKQITDRYSEGHVKEGVGMGALINQVLYCHADVILLN